MTDAVDERPFLVPSEYRPNLGIPLEILHTLTIYPQQGLLDLEW